MKVLVLLFSILFIEHSLAQTQAQCPEAGISQISTCYAAYFKNFNFTSTPSVKDYVAAITRQMALGVNGFKEICQWANPRLACIGSYDPVCATATAFQQALGVSQNDAIQFLGFYGATNWECNAGYNDVVSDYYCYENIHMNHDQDRVNCLIQYNNTVIQQGFSCSALGKFVQCYTNVYRKYCGAEGAYIGCNIAKASSVEDAPFCASQMPPCTKSIDVNKLVLLRKKLSASIISQKFMHG
uniref:Uncharacterized protein n=1 Tax=Acrobeloides nanus TaxID=290746 RepID=A0A914DYW5_9BILA